MRTKKFAALLLSGAMLTSVLSGCGGIKKDAVVATLDGKEITLGVANFAARLAQANLDDIYAAYFGEDVWAKDLYNSGSTAQDSVKESVIQSVKEMYILQNHMEDYAISLSEDEEKKITETASAFLTDNTETALEQLGATQEIVEEYLTLSTIQAKMKEAVEAEADTNVSEEEANQRGYSYVRISKEGTTDEENNQKAYTEEELKELEKTVTKLAEACRKDFDGAITDAGYTVSTGAYGTDETGLDEQVVTALDSLKEGEISELVSTDSAYYILRLDADCDKEATEAKKKEIIEERKAAKYDEVYKAWEEAAEWTLKEDVWATVVFDDVFTTVTEDTETEEQQTEEVEATENVK